MRHLRLPVSAGLALPAILLLACAGAPAGSPGLPASASAEPASASAEPAASPAAASPVASIPSLAPASPPASSPVTVSVGSPAQAAALVLAANDQFAGTGPLFGDLIGQSRWYVASQAADGFAVSVTFGAGDCQAGCIEQHTWHYSVSPEGLITLTGEDGVAVDSPPPVAGDGPATVSVRVAASPICPVEREPPDPQCAPRPVADYEVILRDPSGSEVARGTTSAEGTVSFDVPAGAYYVEPAAKPVIGNAEGVAFSVVGGQQMAVVISVDTGIR